MRSLVTGGAGFIGSHLVERLLADGEHVTVLDDLSTGRSRNLDHLIGRADVELRRGSVTDPAAVRQAMDGADRVYHLAAAVGVRLIVDSPLSSMRTNIHGTEMVLEAAHQSGAEVLLASTSEVYGKNTSDLLHEDADRVLGSPLVARWSYSAAKGLDEALAHAYWNELSLPVTIVRLFNTVGPRQSDQYGMVLPRLVGQALRGEALTVYGDGRQTRCFSYVSDVVEAMVALAGEPGAHGSAYNLGGAEEISMLDLARRILAVTGSPSPVDLVPYNLAYGPGFEDMRRRVPDNSRAHALIGYRPSTPLDTVIARVAEHLLDPRSAPSAAVT
ncbi:NAD-dependent epimerase/dehydratase family protein [Aeromicrobium sp. CTD01-1L150]|uniref:NAD-dependent epimerase/dehydratase family protein n=1 Tax=Aeromicrobium sp. CTD01-1L150 TaxID=3341830 RepID=UPI0035C06576